MTDASDDDKLGYGRPPRKHQFQKGQSGNPKGRPKGSKNKLPRGGLNNILEIVRKEANRKVKVTEGEKRVNIPMIQAVVRSAAVKAGKGSVPAQRLFLGLALDAETLADQRHTALVEAVVHYKLGWQELFEEYDASGLPRPDVMPHPDDIHIDPQTGEVLVLGPLTKEQRDKENTRLQSIFKEEIVRLKHELSEFESQLKTDTPPDEIELVEFLIRTRKTAIKLFEKKLRTMKGRYRIKCMLVPDSTGNSFKIEQY